MYQNKLAVAIKTAGKVLREQGDKVFLPFGSEYSIFLKNLNSVRALVRVSLDGNSVTDGEDLVIYGNNELNLERFLKAGNMNSGNRFKFIERSAKVEAHRGIEAEDGLLRVEFQFEKVTPKPIVVETIHKHYHDYYKHYPYNDPYWYPNKIYYNSSPSFGMGAVADSAVYTCSASNNMSGASGSLSGGSVTSNAVGIPMNAGTQSVNVNFTQTASAPKGATRSLLKKSSKAVAEAQAMNQVVNDAGITVAGSVSEQKFQTASWFAVDDEKFVIVLKLLGETGGQVIAQPVLVRQKQTCMSCGTRNRGQNQFCRECGTALELVGQSPTRRVGVRG